MESGVNGPGLMGTEGGAQLGAAPGLPQFALDAVEMADLTQEPTCDHRSLILGFVKLPPRMRPAGRQLDVLLMAGVAAVGGIAVALHCALEVDGQHFSVQHFQIGDAAIQALTLQDAQLDFGHVEPTAVLGHMVELEAVDQAPGFLWGEGGV